MNSSTSILTTDCKTLVSYSLSIPSEDRNFYPPTDLFFIPSNLLCSERLELRTKGDKQRERETDHAAVLNGDIKSLWS